jgi:hypothetical protein
LDINYPHSLLLNGTTYLFIIIIDESQRAIAMYSPPKKIEHLAGNSSSGLPPELGYLIKHRYTKNDLNHTYFNCSVTN